MHPYTRASIASALSRQTLSIHGAFSRSKSSRENLLIRGSAPAVDLLCALAVFYDELTQVSKLRGLCVLLVCCADSQW